MNLETIKNTYAQEQGFDDWTELAIINELNADKLDRHWTEICIRAQKLYRDNILEKIHNINFAHQAGYIETISSITNPENLIR